MSKSNIEKLAVCLLKSAKEISGRDMLDRIDTISYKQRKRNYLDKLLELKLLRMTKPEKPTARDQRYVCTDLGFQIIKK